MFYFLCITVTLFVNLPLIVCSCVTVMTDCVCVCVLGFIIFSKDALLEEVKEEQSLDGSYAE